MAIEWDNLFSALSLSWDLTDNNVVTHAKNTAAVIFGCNTVPWRSWTDRDIWHEDLQMAKVLRKLKSTKCLQFEQMGLETFYSRRHASQSNIKEFQLLSSLKQTDANQEPLGGINTKSS